MSTTNTLNLPFSEATPSIAKKAALWGYGITSYLVGFGGMLAIIFAMAGFIPLGQVAPFIENSALAVAFNIALTFLFGLQHSIMARPWFKHILHQYLGQACERSTFILASGLVSIFMIALWQPVGGVVWQADSTLAMIALWVLFAGGWSYLMAATFAINHWDLFGLRQIWFAAQGHPYVAPEFKEGWMYGFSRHPIMLGVLMGIWFLPTMSATQLVLSISFTAYIFIGVWFEEKDLLQQFGQRYADYKQRVGMFFTL